MHVERNMQNDRKNIFFETMKTHAKQSSPKVIIKVEQKLNFNLIQKPLYIQIMHILHIFVIFSQ